MAVARSHLDEAVELPQDRVAALKVLRRHGMKGLSINEIEPPRRTPRGPESRVYCLTRPMLCEDDVMRRRPRTVVFWVADGELVARKIDGWLVRDLRPHEAA